MNLIVAILLKKRDLQIINYNDSKQKDWKNNGSTSNIQNIQFISNIHTFFFFNNQPIQMHFPSNLHSFSCRIHLIEVLLVVAYSISSDFI